MKTSPTQRSLKFLRDRGYTAQVVEKWNQFAKVRQDLFGFIDIVAIKPGIVGVLGVQTTSKAHLSDREKKAEKLETYKIWLECGNKVWMMGWKKSGAKGKRKLWNCTIRTPDSGSWELLETPNL